MTPDDPRHGTNAGFLTHRRANQSPCQPCADARRQFNKLARIDAERGRPRMVTLGDRAHAALTSTPRDQMSRATGIGVHQLCRYIAAGPTKRIHRTTRDRILTASAQQFWTPIGIQRRLRALNAIGWSMEALAADIGLWPAALRDLANRDRLPYIQRTTAANIIAAYARLGMDPVPAGKSGTRARNDAIRKGWVGPLAWDDIDNDPAPLGMRSAHNNREYDGQDIIDEATVLRILSGEVLHANAAERREVMRRWLAAGKSERSLCDRMGWKDGRYVTRDEAVA